MFTVQDTTTVRRWQPTYLDRINVEAALEEIGQSYEDLYPSPRTGRWQIEVIGMWADKIARKLNNRPGFWEAAGVQDYTDDGKLLSLVTFSHEWPDENDPYYNVDIFED